MEAEFPPTGSLLLKSPLNAAERCIPFLLVHLFQLVVFPQIMLDLLAMILMAPCHFPSEYLSQLKLSLPYLQDKGQPSLVPFS